MRRRTALDIAERFFRSGRLMPLGLRDEIIATQMAQADAQPRETTFVGWTTDEKIAFYAHGKVPARFRT